MDVYAISFDLKPGVQDVAFAEAVARYLDPLKQSDLIAAWRLLRRKLGFGPPGTGEWTILIETRDLAQLDEAFRHVAARAGPVEGFHFEVNRHATNLVFSLMRDFPDPFRVRGAEKF